MSIFKDKRVLITGASSGIGKELSIQLNLLGAEVILASRNKVTLEEVRNVVSNPNKCHILTYDASEDSSVQSLAKTIIEQFSSIDILINNAGVSQRSLTKESDFEKVDKYLMQVNYLSTIRLTKLLLPIIDEKEGNGIIVLSSLAGEFGFPLRSAYCASKHALNGFFETLQLELIASPLRILIAVPGRINTPISFSSLTADGKQYNQQSEGQAKGILVSVCVDKILSAYSKGLKKILIAKEEKILWRIKKIFPSLFYKIAANLKAN